MELPAKKYKCILADPPWSYDDKKTGGTNMISGACYKYSTLNLDEIKQLPVRDICMKDSCLFLWATTPLLPEAFEVMNAWGFKYKTSIYWRKIMSLGMGYWFRGQVELCLLGIKGKLKAFHSQRPNFIQTKARKHSEKPDELYGMIEELNINPKIELFARKRRGGWDSWGDQLSDTCQRILLKER